MTRLKMSSEPEDLETAWMHVSFDFKFLRSTFELDDVDEKKLLLGLGRAIAYLLLPDEEYPNTKVFVRNLDLNETDFLSDEDIIRALNEFGREDGEEP